MSSQLTVSTTIIELIDRVKQGDITARDKLLRHACDRLRTLVAKQLKRYPAVARWEQTDDVLQDVLIRLSRALRDIPLNDAKHFFALASMMTRRELIDLKRKHYGPEGGGANHATRKAETDGSCAPNRLSAAPGRERSPETLIAWAELHELVEKLDPELREVVDLLWYQGLEQEEAASLLGISSKTVSRRWREARIRLGELLVS